MKKQFALITLAATGSAVEAELGAGMKPGDQLLQEVIQQCQDDFGVSLAEFVPGDYPAKALHDMTVNTCLKLADSIPKGLQPVMCAYRSLYSLISYKLLERDLKELKKQSVDDIQEQIEDYAPLFGETYCKDLQANFKTQISEVDNYLRQEGGEFKAWCKGLFDEQLTLFSPQINTMNSETLFYDTEELCNTFTVAYKELKKEFDEEVESRTSHGFIEVDKKETESFRVNLIKLLNVLPFELFIEKQHSSFRQNCYNEVMLGWIKDPETYCTQTMVDRIDFTLWTDKNQQDGCIDAFAEVSNLSKLGEECAEDVDAPSCDPCTKISDSIFEKYRQFVTNNLLSIMGQIAAAETEDGIIDIAAEDL